MQSASTGLFASKRESESFSFSKTTKNLLEKPNQSESTSAPIDLPVVVVSPLVVAIDSHDLDARVEDFSEDRTVTVRREGRHVVYLVYWPLVDVFVAVVSVHLLVWCFVSIPLILHKRSCFDCDFTFFVHIMQKRLEIRGSRY